MRESIGQLSHPVKAWDTRITKPRSAKYYLHSRLHVHKWACWDQLRSAELTSKPTHSPTKIKVCCCSHWGVMVGCHVALFKQAVTNIKSQCLRMLYITYNSIKRKDFINTSIKSFFFPVCIMWLCSFQFLERKKTCFEQDIRKEIICVQQASLMNN